MGTFEDVLKVISWILSWFRDLCDRRQLGSSSENVGTISESSDGLRAR